MLFNSYQFIFVFLPLVFAIYYLISSKSHFGALVWLSMASLFFYGYWSLYSLPILASSICVNYYFGLKLSDINLKYRKYLLISSISLNLILLGYFKYANFFIENTNEFLHIIKLEPFQILNVVLPIGISFFTFTQIAYLVDSYQGKVKEKSFQQYVLFVSFFPHLIAGPIIHHKQMMPQFSDAKNFKINTEKISIGIILFTIGLAKKLLLADPLGSYADILFNGVKSGMSPKFMISWVGSFAYSFQLYFDFSGYSDMAVGLALLFGIWLPFNFNSPFKSTNIINFWQRWHISLTKYIGEYLHTPITLMMMRLSNGKSGIIDIICNLIFPTFLIFLILGFWHGPSWTYVLFGCMHGMYIVVNQLWKKAFPYKKSKSPMLFNIRSIFGWFVTFIAVNISFVMFRADSVSNAFQIYRVMLNPNEFLLILHRIQIGSIFDPLKGIWQSQLESNQSTLDSYILLIIGFIIVVFFQIVQVFHQIIHLVIIVY